MSDDRIQEMSEAFLLGTLSPGERDELTAAVRRDPALCSALLAEVEMDLLLGALHDEAQAAARVCAKVTLLALHERESRKLRTTRAVNRRLPRRTRLWKTWWWPATAAVLMLLVSGLWWSRTTDKPLATVVAAQDSFIVHDGRKQLAVPGAGLFAEDVIVGSAGVRWEDGSRIDGDPAARIALRATTSGKRLELSTGSLSATIAKQPFGQSFRIDTAQAAIEVVGTRLTVTSDGHLTRVAVSEGLVRVTDRITTRVADIAAGHADEFGRSQSVPSPTDHQPVIDRMAQGLRLHFAADRGVSQISGAVSAWRDQVSDQRAVINRDQPPLLAATAFFGRPALIFDGRQTTLTLENRDQLNAVSVGTIAVWVQLDAGTSSPTQAFFSADTGINQHPFEFGLQSGELQIWTSPTPVPQELLMSQTGPASAISAPLGAIAGWHHLAYCADAANRRLYVDGRQVATRLTRGPDPHQAPFFAYAASVGTIYRIGATAEGEHLLGKIADLRIWDRALGDQELRLLAEPPASLPDQSR